MQFYTVWILVIALLGLTGCVGFRTSGSIDVIEVQKQRDLGSTPPSELKKRVKHSDCGVVHRCGSQVGGRLTGISSIIGGPWMIRGIEKTCDIKFHGIDEKFSIALSSPGYVHIIGLPTIGILPMAKFCGRQYATIPWQYRDRLFETVYPYMNLEQRLALYEQYLTKEQFVDNEFSNKHEGQVWLSRSEVKQEKFRAKYSEEITLTSRPVYSDFYNKLNGPKHNPVSTRFVPVVESYIAYLTNQYINLADVDLPEPVPTPQLPQAIKLEQKQLESVKAFQQRLQLAYESRDAEFTKLQSAHSKAVEQRNQRIQELKLLRQARLNQIKETPLMFISDALNATFEKGQFMLKDFAFDQKIGLITMDLVNHSPSFLETIGMTSNETHITEALSRQVSKISPEVIFKLKGDGFAFDRIRFSLNGDSESLVAAATDKKATGEVHRLSAVIDGAQGVKDGLEKIDLLQEQPLDLTDTQFRATVTYNDGRVMKLTGDPELAERVEDLPRQRENRSNYLFALGIEEYRNSQSVPYANNSTELMVELLQKRYGIPEVNTYHLTGDDTTGTVIKAKLEFLLGRIDEGDQVFFYYAGHGAPARNRRFVYILPSDFVTGSYEDQQFSTTYIFDRFKDSGAEVVALLDTCFSGKNSSPVDSMLQGVAAIDIVAKVAEPPQNVSVFYAGYSDQFANEYKDKGHRLFSYYLIDALLDNPGNWNDLEEKVRHQVRRVSAERGPVYRQDPYVETKKQRLPK